MIIPVLSEEIYNNPAKFEYFVRFVIIGLEDNKEFTLFLVGKDNTRGEYCGKVLKGETLEQTIKNELFNSFKIEKIKKYYCYEKQESAPNRYGDILPRVVVEVTIDINQVKNKNFQNSYILWEEIIKSEKLPPDYWKKRDTDFENWKKKANAKFDEMVEKLKNNYEYSYHAEYGDSYRMEALEYFKLNGGLAGNRFETQEESEIFIKNLYYLGAEIVDIVDIHIYKDEKYVGSDSLEIFPPIDPIKRSALVKIANVEGENEGFPPEEDNGEKIIGLGWD